MHDKEKKVINYKHAWLKYMTNQLSISQSFFILIQLLKDSQDFCAANYNSSSLGLSFKLPYYKVISDNKDITFIPRIFSENEVMFQNEYRQVNKNSKHISDFSLKEKNSTSKLTFFQILLLSLIWKYLI